MNTLVYFVSYHKCEISNEMKITGMDRSKVAKNDRWPIMNGPIINRIFVDCPFGGDK